MNGFIKTLSEGKLLKVTFTEIRKRIDRLFANIFNEFYFRHREIDNHKITMVTSRGSYNCNPKAIAEYIIQQGLPYKIVWVIRKENLMELEQYPPNLILVRRGSFDFYKEAYTSRIWIDNSVTMPYLFAKKRKNQVYIETWHGSFGLKRFDDNNNRYWVKMAKRAGAQTDYCLTNCEFEDELFRKTFWKNAQMLRYGHSRNDSIINTDGEQHGKLDLHIREKYSIPKEAKIALYAPTYRDTGNRSVYALDYDAILAALRKKYGGEWRILVRFHFLDRQMAAVNNKHPHIVNVTDYTDIQDIMAITDVGITDYSSWVYDYIFTGKPVYLFVPDIDEYTTKDREFLFPIESTPFPIAKTNEQFVDNILNFDKNKYEMRRKEFLQEKDCIENGKATERLVEKIKEIISHYEV